ncbi:MAG: hypothetical protein ACKO2Z_24990, partial [Sphaerospermopsis kisseleviana]
MPSHQSPVPCHLSPVRSLNFCNSCCWDEFGVGVMVFWGMFSALSIAAGTVGVTAFSGEDGSEIITGGNNSGCVFNWIISVVGNGVKITTLLIFSTAFISG